MIIAFVVGVSLAMLSFGYAQSTGPTTTQPPIRVGERQTLAKGSWLFVDERAYNECLVARETNDVEKLSDLEKSSRAFKTSRDHPVFIVAPDGFAGLVKVRTRTAGYSRWLLWTSPENIKPIAPPDEFHAAEAVLSKDVEIYKRLDVLRAYEKADAADNEEQAKRLGKKLNADLIWVRRETRVKVLERDHDPRFYQVEATLPNGSVVRGWARAQELKPMSEDAEQPADGRIRQWQKFRLGDYAYEIKGCELRARLGSKYLSYTKPGAGAVFVLVRFAIANETKKTATVMSDDFTLRDAQGREFRPASKALTALMMEDENKDFLLTEIQPGIEKESITAFEVPKTALVGDLILIVPEKGFAGSKTVEVLIKL